SEQKHLRSVRGPRLECCAAGFADQFRSVVNQVVLDLIIDPTTHVPAERPGARPPAAPKLTSPRQSAAIARASAVGSARPSPAQTAHVSVPAAMRASRANPETPSTAATKWSLPCRQRMLHAPQAATHLSFTCFLRIPTRLLSNQLSGVSKNARSSMLFPRMSSNVGVRF